MQGYRVLIWGVFFRFIVVFGGAAAEAERIPEFFAVDVSYLVIGQSLTINVRENQLKHYKTIL